MVIFCSLMFISLLVMTVFTEWIKGFVYSNAIEVGCTMVFVGAFEMSFGLITVKSEYDGAARPQTVLALQSSLASPHSHDLLIGPPGAAAAAAARSLANIS